MTEGMTLSDFAALEKIGNRHRGIAATGLGIGIGALALGLAGLWGVNAASQARSRAAEAAASQNATRTSDVITLLANERVSRETWQRANQPTIGQYVDVQTNPNLNATLQDYVAAMAQAQAQATANANSGINSAVATDPALRVMLYGAPQPCNCPGCNL